MRKNYEYMKQKAGLASNEKEEEDKLKVDDIFQKLRPDSPYKLSEMLNPGFNPKRKLDALARDGKNFEGKWRELAVECSAEEVKNYCLYHSTEGKRSSISSIGSRAKKVPSRPRTGMDYSYQASFHRSLLANARKLSQNASRLDMQVKDKMKVQE
eukprot:TRINITY_DN1714_c0_g1_i1.p6 TRINITY_DN1714_c0_g1~~TRINITY_DN1714_c0_g1_i1.p6  ORF type:complete len:155 (+),score=11.62 TRINITY_DN1714_c0_g1_i1:1339-1803(+)